MALQHTHDTWKTVMQYFNDLHKQPNVSVTKILVVKNALLMHFLRFIKLQNIIQTERLRYAKICQKRRLEIKFHDLKNNCPGKL